MDTSNKKSRADLQTYFKKTKIPTEDNFKELIDAPLNQRDDGIYKPVNSALCIQASSQDHKPILSFYEAFTDSNASWVMSLGTSVGARGFALSNGSGAPSPADVRFFIKPDGNIGIGTVDPTHKLTVGGSFAAQSADITGDLTVHSMLDVNGALIAHDKLDVTNAITAKSTIDAIGVVTAHDKLDVIGALAAKSTLDVTGKLTAESTMEARGALKANSTLDVMGTLTANSTMEALGALTAHNKLDVTGGLRANSTLDVTGALKAKSTLDVTGVLTANAGIDIKTETRPVADGFLHPQNRPLYVTGVTDAKPIEFRKSDATEGLAFGPSTISAAGTNATQNIVLMPKGTAQAPGFVRVESGLKVSGELQIGSISPTAEASSPDLGIAARSGGTVNITGKVTTNSTVDVAGKLSAGTLAIGSGGMTATKIVDTISSEATVDANTLPTKKAIVDYVKLVAPASTNDLSTASPTALATAQAVKDFVNGAIPIGGIIMWNGSVPPAGWAICDGGFSEKLQRNKPNLINKFIYGGKTDSVVEGGSLSSSVTLIDANLPPHSHTVSIGSSGEHAHVLKYYAASFSDGGSEKEGSMAPHSADAGRTGRVDIDAGGSHSHTGTATGKTSAAQPFAVPTMPPYYVLAFIIRES